MEILALHRSADHRDRGWALADVGDVEGVLPRRFFASSELHALLAASDVTVLVVPLTSETRGWFDEAAIRAMKPGSILVNAARGGIVEEPALVAALRDGHLGAAILDVFDREPLPPENPLWTMPNVIMSPHVAGHSRLYERRASLVFTENLRRWLRGEPLLNVVDRVLQY
jgi:phosphoglycerate dehydrogenase-like enzyme